MSETRLTRVYIILRDLVDTGSLEFARCAMFVRYNLTLASLEKKGLVTLEAGTWRPTEEGETL